MAKQLSGAGLRGQVAGKTALSTVGKSGSGLTYRGYDVKDLAENCVFEEVAYLILKGELPTQAQLDEYKALLKGMRALPEALKEVLERIPADAHPMDVMRTGCSMLGNLEGEDDSVMGEFPDQQAKTDRMLAAFPSIICYWYRFSHDGVRIETDLADADPRTEGLEVHVGVFQHDHKRHLALFVLEKEVLAMSAWQVAAQGFAFLDRVQGRMFDRGGVNSQVIETGK